MAGWSEHDIPDLAGRRILITGAASGIGFEAARALARQGAEVLLVDRNEGAGHAALERIRALRSDARVRFLPLDLSRQQSVKDFAARLLAERRPLDVLINNAGIQPISERRTSPDGFELTFAIGHLGHFTLTGLLLPLLLAAPSPRVVTVSSMVHGRGYLQWDDLQMERTYSSQRPYNQTKLANLLFARELQKRADASGKRLMSIAVHPGVARTAIGANRKNLGRYRLGDHMISLTLSFVMPFLGQPASAGALPTVYGAVSPEARGGGFYGPDGFGEMKGAPGIATIKPAGQDMEAAERLWKISEQLTGVTFEALQD
ncbi:MAG: SDR family oxidoreductase [Proteobacteria bacterium]|nr:SDR family oxidoreductase [Pseudomonadota bacterium]HQR03121.1 SDR family oxidoreductase [Rhodocyclaceae bacterium]